MRDSYRQQAQFVNDASHELRTPIAVIQGYANLLDRWGKSDQQTLEEVISAIKNEADHMNHLVEQLLFLARGDSGKTTLNLTEADACDLIREVYDRMSLTARSYCRILRVSRTIADLDSSEEVLPGHIMEAVSFRAVDRKYWEDALKKY